MKSDLSGWAAWAPAMTRRLIEAGHDVGTDNRTPEKLKEADRARRQAPSTRSRPPPLMARRSLRCWPTTPL